VKAAGFKLIPFSRIQFFLKVIFLSVGIYTSLNLNLYKEMILLSMTILFLTFQKGMIISWFKTILKLIPLFISLLLFSILAKTDYFEMILLILKISYMLLLSVYLVELIKFPENIKNQNLNEMSLGKKLQFFLYATLQYMFALLDHFSKLSFQKKDLAGILSDSMKKKEELDLEKEYNFEQGSPLHNSLTDTSVDTIRILLLTILTGFLLLVNI
jgi:hypothetical protein